MLRIRGWILKLGCLITMAMSLVGCKQSSNSTTDKSSDGGATVFRPNSGPSKRTSGGAEVTLVTFLFRNDTNRVVKLPGYFGMGPKDGVLRVNFTEYEVQVAGKWEPLNIGYCGIPEYYPVQPDNELRLEITLEPFEWLQVSRDASVRVKLGDFTSQGVRVAEFTSEVFTLDDIIGGKKDPPQGH